MFNFKLTVGNKILVLIALLVITATILVSLIAYQLNLNAIIDQNRAYISNLSDIKKEKIEAQINEINHNIKVIQNLNELQNHWEQIVNPTADEPLQGTGNNSDLDGLFGDSEPSANLSEANMSNDPLLAALMGEDANMMSDLMGDGANQATTAKQQPKDADLNYQQNLKNLATLFGFENIYLLQANGKIIYSSHPSGKGDQKGDFINDPDGNTLESAKEAIYHSFIHKVKNNYYTLVGAPIRTPDGQLNGLVAARINMNKLFKAIQDTTGLGRTGEIVVGKQYGTKVIIQNPLRHDSTTALRKSVVLGEKNFEALQKAAKGENGIGMQTDYRNKKTLAGWRYLPSTGWGMVVKKDMEEIKQPIKNLVGYFWVMSLMILLITLIAGVYFGKSVGQPLSKLKAVMQLLGRGELPDAVQIRTSDEIGQIGATANQLVEGLQQTAQFARQIGEGNFEAEFTPMSEGDTLGIALLQMRKSLMEASSRDQERNWIVRGVAELSEILRNHNQINDLGDNVVAYLAKKLDAVQAAFYIVEKNEEEEKAIIKLSSAYAYNKKKYLTATFEFGEGLIGQSAIEQDTLLRTEIPQDYVTITSGLLGDRRPDVLLIVPLISNEQVYGVVEVAGFDMFSQMGINFVKEISQILAQTVFNIQVNNRTKMLLEASQKMSSELQQQQEELRQNAEEMAATQEELKRSNLQLENQIEEVNRAQKKMEVLLQNASEVIVIYEKDMTVRYISPSVEKILGYTSEEMIGIKDIRYVHAEGVAEVENMFGNLLKNPDERITIQYSYMQKNGEEVWLEATGTNQLDDPAIEGIVVNLRDITERRIAEREARMRGQMQSLSENSPDLITRVGRKGEIFYVNPAIKDYTGYETTEFQSKKLHDKEFENQGLLQVFKDLLSKVENDPRKLTIEADFESIMGERVAQINAIPEFNEVEKLESVLLVSHDITDRKLIELEIQNKNKKITESINYAKRIQSAILPDNAMINDMFPESFMLYKPRDVVSGDFPWFLKKGDDIYIAAVDCTGHGVPGALISLIGYFLLNNIIDSHESLTPGQILDMLDQAVTHTLKQDLDDSTTRDGMDIALCKINQTTNSLEFSGAHRPLYRIRNNELEQFKGDKYPIGGGQYKNRDNFTNYEFEIQPDDFILFFSDGFPDQFGGPNDRKFSPRRIREIMTENASKPLTEVHLAYEQAFTDWMGSTKQTDDVLMIGIRF